MSSIEMSVFCRLSIRYGVNNVLEGAYGVVSSLTSVRIYKRL